MSHLPAGDRGSDERAATESAGTGAGQAVTEPAAAPPLKSWEEMRE